MFVEQARVFVDFCHFLSSLRVRQADLSQRLVYHAVLHQTPGRRTPSSPANVCTYTDRVP